MSDDKGRIRAAETAKVTDACLSELGIDCAKLPPDALLFPMIEEVAEEQGVELTLAELRYVGKVALAWVFNDVDEAKATEGAKLRREARADMAKGDPIW